MILISHRGNLNGKSDDENKPEYIDFAISEGFDVEVDVWFNSGDWYLGHDLPEYKINIKWLLDREPKLWIHCKNIESLIVVKKYCLHYFWYENDTYTLTSKNYIWAYPRKNIIKESIVLLPELYNNDLNNSKGVCSDYIKKYKR